MPAVSSPPRHTPSRQFQERQAWIQALLEAFAEGPLTQERQSARLALAATDLPGRSQEAWRFTDLSLLPQLAPQPLSPPTSPRRPLPAPHSTSWRLQLDAGATSADLSWPEGLEPVPPSLLPASLGMALTGTAADDHWSAQLNCAIASDLLALRIRGRVAPCLELVSDTGPHAGVQPLRLVLLLEDGADLDLLQVHQATGPNLTSVVLEVHMGRDAVLRHGVVAEGTDNAVLLATTAVRQAPGSFYDQASVCSGWGLVRQEPVILQSDGQARTRLRGLQWVEGRQMADTHSRVRFAGPGGTLDQLHKVVADGEGRSVFNGCVQVPRQAQRTQAAQLSRGLLLSDRARIDTKPELEIVADDVRCTHGATISRLQEEELFYLRSRGVGATQAARLLLRGFCEEVRASLPDAAAVWDPLSTLLSEAR
jgi:FeS assembly protein SufD